MSIQQHKPPLIKCEGCKKRIKGTVYFQSHYGRPRCADCTREARRERGVQWYEMFGAKLGETFEEFLAKSDTELPRSRDCVVCGREIAWVIHKRWGSPWVCSSECEAERANAKRRVQPEPKICEVCGKSFTPKRSDARTCSDRCRQRLRRSRVNAGARDGGA